jgi:RNA polymerase sigma-70 factor (ECF subfamily)
VIVSIQGRSEARESRLHHALIDQAQRGDREAFDALARTVGDTCMAIAFRILRDVDQAQDAVQTALIVAWRELRTLRDADRFEPWLHRILTNECYAEARRRNRWSSAQVRLLPVPGHRDSAEISAINDRDQLDRAFRRLTLEQRSVLVFHHYVGLPLTEVADHLGIPLGTAKSRLHHATSALRASLEADARTPSTSQERLA